MTDTHEAHRLAKLLSADPTESPVSLAASALLLRIPELEAENAAWRKQADTLTHQVICCGVAASHPDPELTKHGAYAGKWNSAQAEEVRKLRAERDQLRAELEKVRVLYTQPAAGADVLDAERWRYAMDWDTRDFAVCRRVGATGTCWEPIKTDGPIDAALSATQPAQAKQSEPAEHWHRLYLEKCQQYNDRVAQLGGVIEGLEAQAAQGVGDKVFLVATGEIYEGQETYERYEGSPPPLCDYEVLYTVPQPAVAQGASEVFTALADHCPVDNGWFNGRAAADARDAERYRWLRDQANTSVNIDIGAGCEISDTLDAAIDAVLATHQQRQDGDAPGPVAPACGGKPRGTRNATDD